MSQHARTIGDQAMVFRRNGQSLLVVYSDHTTDRLKCSSSSVAKRLEAYLIGEPTQLDTTPRGFLRRMVQKVDAAQWLGRRRCGRLTS